MIHRIVLAGLLLIWSVLAIGVGNNSLKDSHSQERPRVGLCLSGGGARGAAHLGVLKVIEELNIPIDYIAGTSVGALIGGLYASGMSPEEIHQVVSETDWQKMFQDSPSRENLSYRRKLENGKYLPNLEAGFHNGTVALSSGLTSGQKISFLFHKILLRNGAVCHFDQLRIPFRAVATNLVNGEMVVLEEGSLAEALRASMAVPGAIAPIDLDGRLLSDGGLVRNLPVDVLKGMGADVIIAVDVAKGLYDRHELNSALSVSQQMISILILKGQKEQLSLLGKNDCFLLPDLGNMSASDFAHMEEAEAAGLNYARNHLDVLRNYSVSEDEYKQWKAGQRGISVNSTRVDFLNVSDQTSLEPEVLLNRIETRAGKKLELKTLQNDLDRLYQLDTYENVGFEWVQQDDESGLIIKTREKPWGRHSLKFGLRVTDDFEGNERFNLLFGHTLTQVNKRGAEWKNEIQLGHTRRFYTEFYQPMDYAGKWAIVPFAGYKSDALEERMLSGSWFQYTLREFESGIKVERLFSNWGALTAGFVSTYGSVTPSYAYGDLESQDTRLRASGYLIEFNYDTLDNPYFPTAGNTGHLSYFRTSDLFGGSLEFEKLDIALGTTRKVNENVFHFSLEYGDSLGTTLPLNQKFRLGGFLHMSGYRQGEMTGNYKIFSRAVYYRQLPLKLFGFKFYAGGSLEAGNVWQTRDAADWGDFRYSGSMFLGADTIAGSLYLGYGHSDDGANLFYLSIGQIF